MLGRGLVPAGEPGAPRRRPRACCAATGSSRPCTCATAGRGCATSTWPGWPGGRRRRPAAARRRRADRPARRRCAPAGRRRWRARCGWSAPGARRPAARPPSTPPWPRCRRRPGRPAGTGSPWPPCRSGCPPTRAPGWTGCRPASSPPRTRSTAPPAAGPRRAGVDDVLWVSSDGYALEGPTANVVWLTGDTLCTVPAASTGILPGTTAAWLLAHAAELGLSAAERMVTPAELHDGRRRLVHLVGTRARRGPHPGRGAPRPAARAPPPCRPCWVSPASQPTVELSRRPGRAGRRGAG